MIEVHAAEWLLPIVAPPLRDGAVAVVEGTIVDVGPRDDVLGRAGVDAHVEDHGEAVLLPGFVNAHCHLEYAAYGGLGDGLPFVPWIADHIRRKRALTPELMLASAHLGAEASLRSGVTSVADCAFAGSALTAAAEAGLRGIVYLEAFGGPSADADAVAEALAARLDALDTEAGPLLRLGVSPHAPHTVAPHVYAALVRTARERSLPIATHVAESAPEIEALVEGTGEMADALRRGPGLAVLGEHPVRRLVRDGVLAADAVAIHLVHVGPEEIALLAGSGAGAAHCPRSNAQLGCGIAPLAALRQAGIAVGLGSDSPSSAVDLDHFAELRAAVFAARARDGDAAALTVADALRLATLDAARAIGLDGLVGALAVGLRADLVVVDVSDTPYAPVDDPAAAVVYAGSPGQVTVTVVDGIVRYRRNEQSRYRAAVTGAREARAALIDPLPSPVP